MARSAADGGDGVLAELTPAWPFRMPGRGGPDGVSRVRDGVFERFLQVEGRPVLIRAWQRPRERDVQIAAIPVESRWLEAGTRPTRVGRAAVGGRRRARGPRAAAGGRGAPEPPRATAEHLELAIERARHALAIDDDYGEFYATFRGDPLLGPAIRSNPWLRARRCFWPWEALAWAVTEQLIEVERAHAIQRRILGRWGAAMLPPDRRGRCAMCRRPRRSPGAPRLSWRRWISHRSGRSP